ncbi:hypothetical protein V6N13_029467 [Hibiscus sabdariffa]|uniref:Uncharacterized protein n=1 Tax=Hibiscus sabdariffa TaxID=183260 RepID=A0ABR2TAH5_9ROSI
MDGVTKSSLTLPIDSTSSFFHGVVHEIIQRASNIGRQVLPLRANIIEERALDESELQGDKDMVPAKDSSVRKMLKRVRVEDDDGCEVVRGSTEKKESEGRRFVICLEEIEVATADFADLA